MPLGYGDNGLSFTFEDQGGAPDAHTYRLGLAGPFPAMIPVSGTVSSDGRKVDPDFVEVSSPRSTFLSDFVGGDPNGTWTLFLADLSSGGLARLDSWSLDFVPVPEPNPGAMAALALGVWVWSRWRCRT